jgi:hypothetical protein
MASFVFNLEIVHSLPTHPTNSVRRQPIDGVRRTSFFVRNLIPVNTFGFFSVLFGRTELISRFEKLDLGPILFHMKANHNN